MTTLVVHELKTELIKKINYKLPARCHIAAVIPYIYLHNDPQGTFKVELIKDSAVVFDKEFTTLDIKIALGSIDAFAHVFYPIVPDNIVQIEAGDYSVRLSATSYTYSDASYIGWIAQHENIQMEPSYSVEEKSYPLGLRIKILKEGIE